jgi:beta-glucosidase
MAKKTRIYRGLTALLAALLVASTSATQTAITYTGTLNSYLGTTTSKVVDNSDGTEDLIYYKSEFGDYNAENLQKLIQATYDESVLEQEEGSVLLKHDNNALPLQSNETRVTLFGHAVVQPVYAPGGANSGAADTGTYVIDLRDALLSAGFAVNDTLYNAYAASDTTRVASNNLQIAGGPSSDGSYNAEPVQGEEPISFYTDALRASWEDDYNDVAIVMLAREGGEDAEMMMVNPDGENALALNQDEKDLLQMIQDSGKFSKVILLLNSAFQMELEWMDDYGIDACLWIGDPGQRGFEGVVNLLTGAANPSGRLVDTYAASSVSSPAAHTSSQNATTWTNMDEVISTVTDAANNTTHVVVQSEGIYVGYKYYETRYEDALLNPASGASSTAGASFGGNWDYATEVTYPFGYGLSYTTFDQKLDGVTYDAASDGFTATVTVTNTGAVAGKSVVELYVQTPYGDYEKENLVEKSAIQVVGFGKTGDLAPGASETLEITVDRYFLASYDYTNAKGYILSAGDYYLAVGDDAHDALNNVLAAKGATGMVDPQGNPVTGDPSKTYKWSYDTLDTQTYRYSDTGVEVTNQFDDADLNYWQDGAVTYLTRSDWAGTFPEEALSVTATAEMMAVLQGELYVKADDAPSASAMTQGVNNGLTFASMRNVAYDDDETWNKYLDQMTIAELASQLSDMFGTTQVESVGKPAMTEGDGTASVGANTFPEEYGDTRDVCLYPCTVVAACTWSAERLTARGDLMAEEALYVGLPLFWAGGGNLHRTPFGGRNGEYFSEDSILVNLMSTIELTTIQNKGVTPGIKHLAGNDQELYREGLVMFFNEQAFREGSLKAFEGVLSNQNTMALMQSFNRLGLVWSSSSYALCTQVVRNEWGFQGMEETDGVIGGAYKYHFSSSLTAGTTTYCIDPLGDSAAGILEAINTTDDGNLLLALRTAVKNYHYTLVHTNMMNGMSANSTIETVMPWWQTAFYALDAVLAVLLVLCAVLLIRSKKTAETVHVEEAKKG